MQKMTFEIAWQLTSSPSSLQTINPKKIRISLFNRNSEGVVDLTTCATHSKFHILRSSMCLYYCKIASNFLSDAWKHLTTTTAINYPNYF